MSIPRQHGPREHQWSQVRVAAGAGAL